jgi:hypothetical protein
MTETTGKNISEIAKELIQKITKKFETIEQTIVPFSNPAFPDLGSCRIYVGNKVVKKIVSIELVFPPASLHSVTICGTRFVKINNLFF